MSLIRIAIIIAVVTTLVFAFACGASESVVDYGYGQESASGRIDTLNVGAADGQFVQSTVVVERVVEREVMADDAMMKAVPTAAPAAMAMDMEMVEGESAQNVNISIQPTNRIIVRNADMSVESNDPNSTIDAINNLAVSRGGWVVNSNTADEGYYHITIRIPADSLDSVIEQIKANVAKVLSVNTDSTDFTEEFIDLGARRSTVQGTVDALTQLLKNENYDSVQELLDVQREITNWQSELERIDGRLAFISESAAFSRLSVNVNRSPIPMQVEVGEDVHVGISVGRKYTARFFPPDDYDRFEITWDFGDGSPPQTAQAGLRTQGEDGLLSVPVRHTYNSDEFSPHVVTATIRAFSDRGVAEGEDQLWATVSELPRFEAFVVASEPNVDQGAPVTITASFNHPDTLRNVEYEMDFRDGSNIVTGTVPAGETGVEVEHVFERFRPQAYRVIFEIRGDSDAGEVMETHETFISVHPGPEIENSDFDAGGTATNAVNVLIAVFTFAGTAGIWLAITSPIWLILGAGIFFLVRYLNRRARNAQRVVFVPDSDPETQDDPTQDDPETR